MWHRATTDFKQAVSCAWVCAERDGTALSTKHLLEGVCRLHVGKELSRRVGVSPDEVEALGVDDKTLAATSVAPEITDAARAARDFAYEEAVAFGDGAVYLEHLLIGLARVEGGAAARFFAERGVTVDDLRAVALDIGPHRTEAPPGLVLTAGQERQLRRARRAALLHRRASLLRRLLRALPTLGRDPLVLAHLAPRKRVQYPHWFFTRLRRRGLYFSAAGNFWVCGRYEDVQTALRAPALSVRRYDLALCENSSPPRLDRHFNSLYASMNRLMLFQDAPEQTRLRSLVSRQFTPRLITGMQTEIQAIADELVDRVAARGRMDVIADFAFPFPATVIARLLGVAEDDLLQFKAWSDDFVRFITFATSFADEVRIHQALEGIGAYFARAIARERASDRSHTLLSLLTHAEGEGGERLTDDEITANALLLLAAGHETTTHLIGNGLRLLLTHPNALRAVQSDPSCLPAAIEEILRFEPPVQWTTRVTKEAVSLGSRTLQPGDRINLCLAAANRDPSRFANPDTFDITRTDNKHMGFGSGPHFCLGAALARMEAEIAFATLLRRLPGLRLQTRAPDWRFDFAFRAQRTLPVVWNTGEQAIQ